MGDRVPLLDLSYSWKQRILENTLLLGWQEDVALRVCGAGRHVSDSELKYKVAPRSLNAAFSKSNVDHKIWRKSYEEELDGLDEHETMTAITEEEYQKLIKKHGETAKAIPTMNVFTIKYDKKGAPVRAKSRIVALGNLE